jgi:hypothetical protein
MKLETLVILVLGGVLLRLWWQSNRRRLSRFLHRWKAHLPRRWHPKTSEACPLCKVHSNGVHRAPQPDPTARRVSPGTAHLVIGPIRSPPAAPRAVVAGLLPPGADPSGVGAPLARLDAALSSTHPGDGLGLDRPCLDRGRVPAYPVVCHLRREYLRFGQACASCSNRKVSQALGNHLRII